eukprot:4286484-Prorocentrum_lima.AAC.1
MTSSLVGSEMCIRDRTKEASQRQSSSGSSVPSLCHCHRMRPTTVPLLVPCLLYTSDAADDM